ncbi:hypothetical protein EVAR_11814_1 [Eumeta japonica]|uniref:Uncharacterized protein n=1 Tax=Eumeta variegata TaxID=151549 RepID=A0A4C1UPF4_EUMVA|nr:hypothetical protein EVAR_11814_1 [Eumeta japonica]
MVLTFKVRRGPTFTTYEPNQHNNDAPISVLSGPRAGTLARASSMPIRASVPGSLKLVNSRQRRYSTQDARAERSRFFSYLTKIARYPRTSL